MEFINDVNTLLEFVQFYFVFSLMLLAVLTFGILKCLHNQDKILRKLSQLEQKGDKTNAEYDECGTESYHCRG